MSWRNHGRIAFHAKHIAEDQQLSGALIMDRDNEAFAVEIMLCHSGSPVGRLIVPRSSICSLKELVRATEIALKQADAGFKSVQFTKAAADAGRAKRLSSKPLRSTTLLSRR